MTDNSHTEQIAYAVCVRMPGDQYYVDEVFSDRQTAINRMMALGGSWIEVMDNPTDKPQLSSKKRIEKPNAIL